MTKHWEESTWLAERAWNKKHREGRNTNKHAKHKARIQHRQKLNTLEETVEKQPQSVLAKFRNGLWWPNVERMFVSQTDS